MAAAIYFEVQIPRKNPKELLWNWSDVRKRKIWNSNCSHLCRQIGTCYTSSFSEWQKVTQELSLAWHRIWFSHNIYNTHKILKRVFAISVIEFQVRGMYVTLLRILCVLWKNLILCQARLISSDKKLHKNWALPCTEYDFRITSMTRMKCLQELQPVMKFQVRWPKVSKNFA